MFKAILLDFRNYRSLLGEFLILRRFNLKLKVYSMLADMYRKATGMKTRVVIVGQEHAMEIWNRDTIKRAKKPTIKKGKFLLADGSSKKGQKIIPPRIPKSWGNLEINRITFYCTMDENGNKPTPEEREEYRLKFNAYAKRYLR